jgi:hypothetical protein
MKTREEHLKWCKERALQYVDQGNLTDAYGSIASDLNKHPETEGHIGLQLGMMQMIGGHLSTAEKMRDFINGFN